MTEPITAPRPRWVVLLTGVAAAAVAALLVSVALNELDSRSPGVGRLTPFTAADAHFRASFPKRPSRADQQVATPGGPLRLVQYTAQVGANLGYSVGWFQLPAPPVDDAAARSFLEATERGSVSAVKGTLVHTAFVSEDGHPGIEYQARVEGGYVSSRTVLVGRDAYVIQVVSTSKTPPKHDEFMASFTALPLAPPE
ncbi:MAG: hypothetical protein QOK43_2260 [Acidimicrobiaceae bacterium]|nr:hypothetical protein [Acidimicrobiaceae bacterium]